MALGERIVQELDQADGVDTLGKWMAHHLASLLEKANDPNEEQTTAKREAVDLIVKLWEHKSSFPGSVDPMSTLKKATEVASRLHPNSSPFYRHGNDKREENLALLFDGLRKLVAHGVLLIADQKEMPDYVAETFEFLTEEEQQFVSAMGGWISFCEGHRPKTPIVKFVYNEEDLDKEEEPVAADLEPEERHRIQLSISIDELIEQLQNFKKDILK